MIATGNVNMSPFERVPFDPYYTPRGQKGGDLFQGYYQRGGQYRVFRGSYQHGDGIGSFFSGLWRTIRPLIVPMAKKAAKAVGKQAVASGTQFATDVISGENVKQAAKQRFGEGVKSLHGQLDRKIQSMVEEQQRGSGHKKRGNKRRLVAPMPFSRRSARGKKRRVAATARDIFDGSYR